MARRDFENVEWGEAQLDDLLGRATWPEPSAASAQRLQAAWAALGDRDRRRRRLLATVTFAATAAGILLAIVGGWRVFRTDSDAGTKSIARAPAVAPAPPIGTPEPPPLPVSRPSTPFEQLVSLGGARRRDDATADGVAAVVDRILNRAGDPGPQVTLPVRADERALLERRLASVAAGNGPAAQRVAAVRFLARFGSRDVLPVLLAAAEDDALAAAALPGVLRLAGPEVVARLARRADVPSETRRACLRLLLAQGGDRGATIYLSFVLDRRRREEALGVSHDLPAPATAALFDALRHPLREYRLAAAAALGASCDEEVGPALRRMVERRDHRREAIAVLLSCREPAAAEYLAALSARPSVRSEIQALREELAGLFNAS